MDKSEVNRIMSMTPEETLAQVRKLALRCRERGQYERAKMFDDMLDLLENQKPNTEYTEQERDERIASLKDIWRRIYEVASGMY